MARYGVKSGISSSEFERIGQIDADFFEVYTEKDDLDTLEAFENSLRKLWEFVNDSKYKIEGVHLPNVNWEQSQDIAYRTNLLADAFDTYMILDTGEIPLTWRAGEEKRSLIEELDYPAPVGIEIPAASSTPWFKRNVLDKKYNFVLDTAHLYTSVCEQEDYREKMEDWITDYGHNLIGIHLDNASSEMDGYPFDSKKGEIDMKYTVETLERLLKDDAKVILEFSNNGEQRRANKQVQSLLENEKTTQPDTPSP